MGRQVRMVPKDWVHPKRCSDGSGGDQPLYDKSYEEAAKEWSEGFILWSDGEHPEQDKDCKYYWEYFGFCEEEFYRSEWWTDDERTHCQMYETVSQGTPISPVFETPEKLAKWLADTGASSFADDTATYEQWLRICKGGWAPSAVMENGVFKSGVEAVTLIEE